MPSILSESATSSVPPSPSAPRSQDSTSSPVCHGFLYDAFLVVPSSLFVLFLAFHAKKNLRKLCSGRSYVMISYYAILWVVSLLNLAWCLFQVLTLFDVTLSLSCTCKDDVFSITPSSSLFFCF